MAQVTATTASQLAQWGFDKPVVTATRTQRPSSDSAASSPNLCDDVSDTLRLDTAAQQQEPSSAARKESLVLQERYLSSEEDLTADDNSGSDSEYDYEDAVIYDPAKECKARTMSISRWDKGKSCDMAVMVSYAFAGRPKVVEMDTRAPTPPHDRPAQRAASVANIPIVSSGDLPKADVPQRLSMNVLGSKEFKSSPITIAPQAETEPRRPSTSYSPSTQQTSDPHPSDASSYSSFMTAPSTRSISPASEEPRRPSSSTIEPMSTRSSVYINSRSRLDLTQTQTAQTTLTHNSYRQSQFGPLTPASPALSFLSSDPYENTTTSSSSPIIKKPAAHKRLRSISMKLALAKIAIAPTKKPYDARSIGGKMPPTPSTPFTPLTPQTAPLEGSSGFPGGNKLRRASTILRPKSRSGLSARPATPESAPPIPLLQQKRMTIGPSRMVARGANEREPTLVLPPCPDSGSEDRMNSIRSESRRLKKRKSLMDFMDSLA